MAEFSNYPRKIDTTAELPKATDNVTAIKAELFNRLRDAIIAIENELGIEPSSTFSTIKARLDALEQGLVSGQAMVIGAVTIQNQNVVIDTHTDTLDFIDNLDVIHPSSGRVQIGIVKSKIRVYRGTSNYTGAALGFPQTVVWNTISSILDNTNAGLISDNTQIAPTKDGTYDISGQLTIHPTTDAVGGITINVVKNGVTTIHTISDDNIVWGVGLKRSFSFSIKTELLAYDAISVTWTHNGSIGSTTSLDFGDNLSWLSLVKIQ